MKIKILITTIDNYETAETIAKDLIKNKLAACVQIIPQSISFFSWQDSLENTKEITIQIKTKTDLVENCKKIILEKHNYKVPEILSIESEILNKSYEEWFNNSIKA